MNLLELGALLKKEREERRLTLRDVTEATKISRRNLTALEDGQLGFLPHPVYLKGYVRNYARLLGLDAEAMVAVVERQSDGDSGYLPHSAVPSGPAPAAQAAPEAKPSAVAEAAPEPEQPAAQPTPAAPEPEASTPPKAEADPMENLAGQLSIAEATGATPRRRPRLWPWVLLLLFGLVMAGLYFQYQRIQAEVEKNPIGAEEPNATAAAPANATDNATQNATEAQSNATAALEAAAQANATPVAAPAAPAAPATTTIPAVPAAAPAKPAAAVTAPAAVPAASIAAGSVEVSRRAAPAAQAEARTPGMQELVVVAKENESCWVEVSEGENRKRFTIANGESRRFEFSAKARVRLGNAGGVSFQLNGAPYPFEGQRGATATLEIQGR